MPLTVNRTQPINELVMKALETFPTLRKAETGLPRSSSLVAVVGVSADQYKEMEDIHVGSHVTGRDRGGTTDYNDSLHTG